MALLMVFACVSLVACDTKKKSKIIGNSKTTTTQQEDEDKNSSSNNSGSSENVDTDNVDTEDVDTEDTDYSDKKVIDWYFDNEDIIDAVAAEMENDYKTVSIDTIGNEVYLYITLKATEVETKYIETLKASNQDMQAKCNDMTQEQVLQFFSEFSKKFEDRGAYPMPTPTMICEVYFDSQGNYIGAVSVSQ